MPAEGDDPVRRNKTGGGMGAAVGPQWSPGAEPLVGVEALEADAFLHIL
jgi:hypothetical protein